MTAGGTPALRSSAFIAGGIADSIKTQNRIPLYQFPEAFEPAIMLSRIKVFAVFGNHHGVFAQQACIGQSGKHLFILFFHFVGRVKKADVHRFAYFGDGGGRVLLQNLKAAREVERQQVLLDQLDRFARGLGKVHHARAAAQGFDSHGASAGKQVKPDRVFNGADGGNHVEQSFAQTVGGGAQFRAGQLAHLPAAEFACDDSHKNSIQHLAVSI